MNFLGEDLRGRVLVAGVGCRGRGDDAFGPLLAEKLRSLGWTEALDCGDRLEDFTFDIAQDNPDVVLVADAVDMGASAGQAALLKVSAVSSDSGRTHDASLGVVLEYLGSRTGAEIRLLGVQPSRFNGADMSPEMNETLQLVVVALDRLLATTNRRRGSETLSDSPLRREPHEGDRQQKQ